MWARPPVTRGHTKALHQGVWGWEWGRGIGAFYRARLWLEAIMANQRKVLAPPIAGLFAGRDRDDVPGYLEAVASQPSPRPGSHSLTTPHRSTNPRHGRTSEQAARATILRIGDDSAHSPHLFYRRRDPKESVVGRSSSDATLIACRNSSDGAIGHRDSSEDVFDPTVSPSLATPVRRDSSTPAYVSSSPPPPPPTQTHPGLLPTPTHPCGTLPAELHLLSGPWWLGHR